MITLKLRIILLVISLLVLFYVVHKIRKSKLDIADSIYWVIFACILLLLSLFPRLAYWCAKLLGIEAPFSFLVVFFIGAISIKQFLLSIRLSELKQKNKHLAQKIAFDEFDEKQEQDTG